jgi:hypothetical protein
MVPRAGIEPATRGFSIPNKALNSFHIVANRDKSDPKEFKGLKAFCKPHFCEFDT